MPITCSQNYDPSVAPDGTEMVYLEALKGASIAADEAATSPGENGGSGKDLRTIRWSLPCATFIIFFDRSTNESPATISSAVRHF